MKKSSDKKIFSQRAILVDGSSFIYRAYYAIKAFLSTKDGFPTRAIFGVSQMLLKILKEWNPDIIVWFGDEPKPTFRHKIYKNYKATRPETPDDLKKQIPYIKKIVSLLGIPMVSKEGYEADDLIATFIAKFQIPSVIVAGDRDLYPLLSKDVAIFDPVRNKFMTEEEFRKKYGFSPEKFIFFRALTGDQSDNIPGVPGVGEKTAIKLVQSFETPENLFENLKKVTPLSLRKNLQAYKDQVLKNLELLSLNKNAPLPSEELSFYRKKEPEWEKLFEIFRKLEFKKLTKTLKEIAEKRGVLTEGKREEKEKEDDDKNDEDFEVKEFESLKDLSQFFKRQNLKTNFLALDLREEKKAFSGLFSKNSSPSFYIFFENPEEAFQNHKIFYIKSGLLSDVLNFQSALKSSFFVCSLKDFLKKTKAKENFSLQNVEEGKFFDLSLMAYLLTPGKKDYSLESLVEDHLFDLEEFQEKRTFSPEKRVFLIYTLGKHLKKRLEEEALLKWFTEVEQPFSYVLFRMEEAGIKVDVNYIKELLKEYEERIKEKREKLFKIAGRPFNPRSSQEIAKILFYKLNLPQIKKTPKASLPSTDAEVLKELASLHPFPALLLEYRTYYKIKSTYLEPLLRHAHPLTHRIHTEFIHTGTATGRISSRNPNLQNIPVRGEEGQKIRKIFVAERGKLFCSMDYSQIELRILAHFSEDRRLIEAFEKGEDIHSFTASEIFGVPISEVTPDMRRLSKVINFGIAYGMSAYGLSKELGISVKEAEDYIEKYFKRYRGIKEYIEKTVAYAREKGYVKTISGRKRYIPEIKSSSYTVRETGKRMAINTPIQGSAADLIKAGMVALQKEIEKRGLKSRILLQIHDEVILEVPEEEKEEIEKLGKEIMEKPFNKLGIDIRLNVPIKINISWGKNWAECK